MFIVNLNKNKPKQDKLVSIMKRDKIIKDSRKSFLAIKSAVAILGVHVSVALTHILQNNY